MKKMILSALAVIFAASLSAQTAPSAAASASAAPASEQREWLQSFNAIAVSAPVDITFIRVADTEAPKIVYDTKGSYTTKFKAEVKEKTLRITERSDSRRPERTRVTVYFNGVNSFSLSDAVATIEGVLQTSMLDVQVAGDAKLTATLDVADLDMELSDRATATLSGKARYFTLTLSSGRLDASQLDAMAVRANVTNGGSASLWVSDRLEATTSTRGQISYKGTPAIIRGGVKFMGSEIKHVE